MSSRFEVVELGVTERYFGIRDNQRQEFLLPEYATTIYFGNRANAEWVARILNKEWREHLRATSLA